MAVREIPRASWHDELDSFSRQHEGWLVSLSTRGTGGTSTVAAHDVPLQGVSTASPHGNDIVISVGRLADRVTHGVHDPDSLALEMTEQGAKRALLIHGRDGSTTRVEFRSPMRPEDVDGLPAFKRD